MGLFGFGKAELSEIDPRQARLRQARADYQARKQEFSDAGALELTCEHGNRLFCHAAYRLAVTQDALRFLPSVNEYDQDDPAALNALQPIELPRAAYQMRHESPAPEVIGQEGRWTRYRVPPFRLFVDGPRTEGVAFFDDCCDLACRYFGARPDTLALRPLYDLFDGKDAKEVRVQEGGAAFGTGSVLLWREGDTLFFLRRNGSPYSRAREISVTQLAVQQVAYYRVEGQIEQELQIRGGELHINREAVWRNDLLNMSFNALADVLESAIELSPMRIEQIPHDRRYVALALQLPEGPCTLQLSLDAQDVLRALLPEHAAAQPDGAPQARRELSPAEQLQILADLVDRGYLTRAAFDAARVRLLGV